MWIFPIIATLIGAASAGVLIRTYSGVRNPACFAWGGALVLLAVASATVFLGSISGWTPFLARTYYLCGATIAVGFMALGLLYVLVPRVIAHAWLAVMLAITLATIVVLAGTDVDAAALSSGEAGWLAIDSSSVLAAISGATSSISILIMAVGVVSGAVYRRLPWVSGAVVAGAIVAGLSNAIASAVQYEFGSIIMAVGMAVLFAGAFLTLHSREVRG